MPEGRTGGHGTTVLSMRQATRAWAGQVVAEPQPLYDGGVLPRGRINWLTAAMTRVFERCAAPSNDPQQRPGLVVRPRAGGPHVPRGLWVWACQPSPGELGRTVPLMLWAVLPV